MGKWTSFRGGSRRSRTETVVFSYIVYNSRAHRDKGQRQDAEGQADRRDDGHERHVLRREAHDLRRLQGHRRLGA
jgi:uncharacterized protein YbaA (DUF1428 family)